MTVAEPQRPTERTAGSPGLFDRFTLRGTEFRNRVWVAPMCQYSSVDGFPTDWHLVHLGGLARGGAGLVLTEATAVTPEGRISPQDAGIWSDEQAAAYRPVVDFVRGQGAVPGIQLAHAGRKGSTLRPWDGRGPVTEGGWPTLGPSPHGYADWPVPHAPDEAELAALVADWAAAARRAVDAGFGVVEVHAAHGYLLHQFLSPLSNHRTDGYGGDLAGRSRLLREIVVAVREQLPDSMPLFVRVSATDWVEGGLTLDEVAEVGRGLGPLGVDLIDVSSGGNSPDQRITAGPGYQVPFAARIRAESGLPVAAVGEITEPGQAQRVLTDGAADAVLLARALLREPSWPQRAARELGAVLDWPVQYVRGRRP